MTKEEKIQEEYGEHWKLFNGSAKQCALKNDGWINPILEHPPKNLELEFGDKFIFRPKSLQGIEDNNGWTKIESKEDLLKENWTNCRVISRENGVEYLYHFSIEISDYWLKNFSHYRKIEDFKNPLF